VTRQRQAVAQDGAGAAARALRLERVVGLSPPARLPDLQGLALAAKPSARLFLGDAATLENVDGTPCGPTPNDPGGTLQLFDQARVDELVAEGVPENEAYVRAAAAFAQTNSQEDNDP